jgi:hypothetical protein
VLALVSLGGGYGICIALSADTSLALTAIGLALAVGLVDAIAREGFSI